ncbi:MAG: hypothetical protein LWX54_15045 [Deltaproteobacteria bacterium]|jgi:hypothetical protein|nr:hypothetical protein [Deltaproteobacteria bacterium]
MGCNIDKSILNARYEDLRNDVLHSFPEIGKQSQGLVLFLRQGMIGWLNAWTKCSPPRTVEDKKEEYAYQDLPVDLCAQVANVLTNMTLNFCREVAVVC